MQQEKRLRRYTTSQKVTSIEEKLPSWQAGKGPTKPPKLACTAKYQVDQILEGKFTKTKQKQKNYVGSKSTPHIN
eukprot:1159962-Pelagomonas_calceolata.AAC.8